MGSFPPPCFHSSSASSWLRPASRRPWLDGRAERRSRGRRPEARDDQSQQGCSGPACWGALGAFAGSAIYEGLGVLCCGGLQASRQWWSWQDATKTRCRNMMRPLMRKRQCASMSLALYCRSWGCPTAVETATKEEGRGVAERRKGWREIPLMRVRDLLPKRGSARRRAYYNAWGGSVEEWA